MRVVRTGLLVTLALLALLGLTPALALAQTTTVPPPAWSTLQATHNWTQNQQPQLDQRHLVWQAWDGHDWEIVSEDLATGTVTQLTNDSLDQTDPRLVGDYVAWIVHAKLSTLSADGRYRFPDYSSTTLGLYDNHSGTTTSVAGSDGIQGLQVGGDLVVWSAGQGTATEVYLHDLATGDTRRVTNDQKEQHLPQTDGRLVVFQTDQSGTRFEVSVYDLQTGTIHLLSDPARSASSPTVNAGRVVWAETDEHSWSISLWDSATDRKTLLSLTAGELQSDPVIGGGKVAWLRRQAPSQDGYLPPDPANARLILYDLATKRETQVGQGVTGGPWLQADGKLLAYSDTSGTKLWVYDTEAGGKPAYLDADPENLAVGGEHDIYNNGPGRGSFFPLNRSLSQDASVVGPSLAGGRVGFGSYQFVNAVYDDTDIVLGYRGASPAKPAAPSPPYRVFVDLSGSPHADAVHLLAGKGIVRGYQEGETLLFAAERPVLRWQFLRMLLDATGVKWFYYSNQSPFTDLGPRDEDHMMYHEVAEAGYVLGITKGVGNDLFHPFASISRAEATTMLIRAAMQLGPQPVPLDPGFRSTLPDFGNPTHAYNLRLAEKNGLLAHLAGFGPGWDPRQTMSRGEAAQVLANLLD